MGGALQAEELSGIIHEAGFRFHMELDEVTDSYAEKWGYGLRIKDVIQKGLIIGKKSL